MDDEFKRRLESYEKGELTPGQVKEIEEELEKLEKYLEIIEEEKQGKFTNTKVNMKKQQRIMKRGKWKARFQTALMVIGLFIIFTIVSAILTMVYYTTGKPDRGEALRNVVDYSLTVMNPYGYLDGSSSNSSAYFGMKATRDLKKVVGDETIKVGEMETKFFFSMMAVPKITYLGATSTNNPAFIYPGSSSRGFSGWDRLKKFPEGTVVSAYVSFSKLMSTEHVFSLFKDKDIRLVWLAVDTGFEKKEESVIEPIGFPSSPIWHDDDMILDSRKEEKGLFGTKTVSESSSSPEYEEGEGEPLHKQFLKTLRFLSKHERIANNFYWGKLNLSERIQYLEDNGFKHYGAVITGPTKEVLKLKDEKKISDVEVDEVRFWNWDNEVDGASE
ncbi:anti-sigma factor [Bacillus sp. 1P06AnD]|uniref:anti-sigma factor n=1 Tax=Bacillus sp. 1P06AnD TaxID=3132208 RepID=UPI0039A18259